LLNLNKFSDCVCIYWESSIIKIISYEREALKEGNYILVSPNIGVIIVMRKRKGKSRIKELVGMIREYRNKYSSIELQRKSKEFWKDVSDWYKHFSWNTFG